MFHAHVSLRVFQAFTASLCCELSFNRRDLKPVNMLKGNRWEPSRFWRHRKKGGNNWWNNVLVFSLLLGLKSQSLVWCLFSATVLIWYISKYHQGNPQNRSCISLLLITSTADTLALPTSFLTVEYCPGFPTDLPLLCFTSKVFYSTRWSPCKAGPVILLPHA